MVISDMADTHGSEDRSNVNGKVSVVPPEQMT